MKKGQLGFIQTLLLIIAGAIILFLVFGKWYTQKMQNTSDVERCRSTALLVDQGRRMTTTKLLNLDCPMRDVYISNDDVQFKGTANKNILFRTIAEEMRTCWYEMGDGTFLPFNQNLMSTESPCIICSRITFDKDLVREFGTKVTGFDSFMDTKMRNSDQTYKEYMDNEQIKNWGFIIYFNLKDKTLNKVNDVDLTKRYYIIYVGILRGSLLNADSPWYKLLQPSSASGGLHNRVYIYLTLEKDLGSIGCSGVANEIENGN